LKHEPVEDFRIDFEDGYGVRSDEEEDLHAALAANELARSIENGTSSAFTGIRIKSLAPETADRALRTLDIFVRGLVEPAGPNLPVAFTVTLPKISSPGDVKRLAKRLARLEKKTGLKKGTIGIEIMIETPSALIDKKGRPTARKLVKAASGRCSSVHFGAYDYTAALGISARDQSLRHPACEFARALMLLSLSQTGVRLSDSVTTQIPAPVHRGEELTPHQVRENRHAVHSAWQAHFDNVLYSMSNGFYQSWDLHPGQLIARFAAVNFFYLDGFDEQARRVRKYVENSAQATLTGASFDDAASVRGLAAFFGRGIGCGALTEAEISAATGLAAADIAGLFDHEKRAALNERRVLVE
jgi:citrate lyase beta subunit